MTMPTLTRRAALAALAAAAATGALAEAPARSLRPVPRPGLRPAGTASTASAAAARPVAGAEAAIAAARLGGRVSCAVIDVGTGRLLDAVEPDLPQPPASTAKALTTLYALDRLGPGHRFATRAIATGPVAGGVVQGDLILSGTGDPTLTTDGLGDLAARLRAAGVRGVAGRFLIHATALPVTAMIDDTQPVHVGYNPAVAGLNLNFNRVHFEWKRAQGGWQVQMDARGERFVPLVRGARVRVVDRAAPLFTYADRDGTETWTVAAAALNTGGSRWLPVRRPAAYVGEVFQTLAAAQGITLPAPQPMPQRPGGTVLAEVASDPLGPMLRDMLRHSTNLTAEAVGMTASGAPSLRASADAMSAWLAQRYGGAPRLVDHSGLGAGSRIAAADMARILAAAHGAGALPPLLRTYPVREGGGAGVPQVLAKTGTLNFVSGLAGYVVGRRTLAFAIFAADTRRRDAIPQAERERPAGASEWTRRARGMQAKLLEGWAAAYG